jgi:large subunit ribosomal protein L18e
MTNEHLRQLITDLRRHSSQQKTKLWKRIADDLEKSTRQRRVVNISRINRNTKENETIIVPGKVLGAGEVHHSVIVAAFSFSESAKERIQEAKGKCLTITELIKTNPKGKNVRIIG